MQSPTSTSPVARAGLTVPSGRTRTVPAILHHVLRAQVVGPVDHALDDAGVVAEVDEGQVLALLPPGGDPAADLDLPADVGDGRAARSSRSASSRAHLMTAAS